MVSLETVTALLRALLIVVLYFIFGFGPGFIVGVILANQFGGGRNQPIRREKHIELIKQASAHNAQWHPNAERWQK